MNPNKQEERDPMPHCLQTPFDREVETKPEPDWRPHAPIIAAVESGEDLPRLPRRATAKQPRHWWGLAADGCYIVIKSGAYLMACWVIAMGLPLMFLLLLTGGKMDMSFAFLGSLFGAFADATPDRQYAFASQATWILVALATAVAAWRLPRFLDEVSDGLKTWRKAQ
jgi:hypothetical protein